MKRIFYLFLAISLMFTQPVFGVDEWMRGTGTDAIDGSGSPSDIDDMIDDYIQNPLDRMLPNYREGCEIIWASTSTLTVGDGEVACSNTAGTANRMRQNTSDTSVTWSDIDTGAEASSTTYYIYAVADADAATFTIKISTSSTAPSGITYFKRLGSFFNNASSNILNDETLTNDNDYYALQMGDWLSRSNNVNYTVTTDGFAIGYGTNTLVKGYTDSLTTPTTLRMSHQGGTSTHINSITMPVKKGDSWRVEGCTGATSGVWWIPTE